MGAELQTNKMRKIHFIIQKQVDFGKALYVVGNIPQLGSWTVQRSLKLCWAKVLFPLFRIIIGPVSLQSLLSIKLAPSSISM